MKTLLIITVLSLVPLQLSGNPQNESGLEVLRLSVKTHVLSGPQDGDGRDLPESVTRPNPNAGRPTNRAETEHERLERQTSQRVQNMHVLEGLKRGPLPRSSITKIYESEAEIRNNSSKAIAGFVWAYQASPPLQFTEDQEFLCAVKLAAGETKRIKVFSIYPNQKVVKVSGSGGVSNPVKPTLKDVIINQVQFSDDTNWKRPKWDPIALSRIGATKVSKGKCIQF